MSVIINEWQLGSRLNQTVNSGLRSDFALWLSFLSPAVEEMAAFSTPDPAIADNAKLDLYQQLAVIPARPFSLRAEDDMVLLYSHNDALNSDGFAQMRLSACLQYPPLVLKDDKNKIAAEVWQNTSLHCRNRIQHPLPDKQQANPTALYDVLQNLAAQPLSWPDNMC